MSRVYFWDYHIEVSEIVWWFTKGCLEKYFMKMTWESFFLLMQHCYGKKRLKIKTRKGFPPASDENSFTSLLNCCIFSWMRMRWENIFDSFELKKKIWEKKIDIDILRWNDCKLVPYSLNSKKLFSDWMLVFWSFFQNSTKFDTRSFLVNFLEH